MNIEEAKIIIRSLKIYYKDEKGQRDLDKEKAEMILDKQDIQAIETLLTAYEKQQKEIEELKEERKKYPIAMNDEQYKKVIEFAQKDIKEELDRQINVRMINEEYIEKNYISKDKIKAKIEECEKQQKEEPDAYLCIKVLRSLFEKE